MPAAFWPEQHLLVRHKIYLLIQKQDKGDVPPFLEHVLTRARTHAHPGCPGKQSAACRLAWRIFPWLFFGLILIMVNSDSLTNKEERFPSPFKTRWQEPKYHSVTALAVRLCQTIHFFLRKWILEWKKTS